MRYKAKEIGKILVNSDISIENYNKIMRYIDTIETDLKNAKAGIKFLEEIIEMKNEQIKTLKEE